MPCITRRNGILPLNWLARPRHLHRNTNQWLSPNPIPQLHTSEILPRWPTVKWLTQWCGFLIDFSIIDWIGSQKIDFFFYNFLKFNFDLSIILKSKNWSLTPHGLFCKKFNFEQLLFEAFSEIMCIFGSVEP